MVRRHILVRIWPPMLCYQLIWCMVSVTMNYFQHVLCVNVSTANTPTGWNMWVGELCARAHRGSLSGTHTSSAEGRQVLAFTIFTTSYISMRADVD
ncbi:hypothetical protein GY45DRAFT_671100 [Cubamyces sp. BRFM 1775]|nr:hypothetical protein GY45DRAFT_671100 [Cubamyces sp. BRFM 1775]